MTDQQAARHRKAVHKALEPVIAAGRAALKDMEEDETPNRLRKVAAATGKRLPPPLATALLAEVDGNDWFRDQVAERLPDDAAALLSAFVRRPEGWWRIVADVVAAEVDAEHVAAISDLTRANDRLQAKLNETKQRTAPPGSVDQTNLQLEEEIRVARARLKELRREMKTGGDAAAAALAELRTKLDEALQQRTELERSVGELQRRLYRSRKDRREERGTAGSASPPSDPLAMARAADLQAAMLAQATSHDDADVGHRPDALRLPAGIRPDSAESLRWLAAAEPAPRFVVDGYNVLFHIDNDRDRAGQARARLNEALRRLRRQAPARPAFTVVYDSALQGDRRSRNTIDGIEIRFAHEGTPADDEIVRLAEEWSRVVVISSDREVQEAASAAGAVVIWAEALAELVQT